MNVADILEGTQRIAAAVKRTTRKPGAYEREAQPVFTVQFALPVHDLAGRQIHEARFARRFYSPGEALDFQDTLPRPSALHCEDRDAAHRMAGG